MNELFQRSYSEDMFNIVIERLDHHNIVSKSKLEVFRQLADRVFTIWKKNLQDDEDYGDDIPAEFQGKNINIS